MTESTNEGRVLGLFADLLEYPHSGLAQTARECRALLAPENEEAADLLAQFVAFAERTPQDMIEEIFTSTFDLDARCHPYIGYHMFGEAYQRSALMLELKDRFTEYDFDPGTELPDHISVLLRFMSICPDTELNQEIGREAILRTLDPMTITPEAQILEDGEEYPPVYDVGRDYRRVLEALRLILRVRYGAPDKIEHIPVPDPERLVS